MGWPIKKPNMPLADEAARAQVTAILEHYQIDVDGIPVDTLKAATDASLEKLVGFVRQGLIEVKDPFAIVQHLKHPPGQERDITYANLKGEHLVAMDGHDPKAYYKKSFALMGALSGWGDEALRSLSDVDLSAALCLGMLFLSA